MNEKRVEVTEQEPSCLLALKDEIIRCWERLPPEHQATMLLVLLDHSAWAEWTGINTRGAWLTLRQQGGESS